MYSIENTHFSLFFSLHCIEAYDGEFLDIIVRTPNAWPAVLDLKNKIKSLYGGADTLERDLVYAAKMEIALEVSRSERALFATYIFWFDFGLFHSEACFERRALPLPDAAHNCEHAYGAFFPNSSFLDALPLGDALLITSNPVAFQARNVLNPAPASYANIGDYLWGAMFGGSKVSKMMNVSRLFCFVFFLWINKIIIFK